jgi:hypothetical protein
LEFLGEYLQEEEELFDTEVENSNPTKTTKLHHEGTKGIVVCADVSVVKVEGRQPKRAANVNNNAINSLKEESKRQEVYRNKVRGNRTDKSTSESVLDQKTRLTLLQVRI